MQGRRSISRSIFRLTLLAVTLGVPVHASAQEAGVNPPHHQASAEDEDSASPHNHNHAGDLLLFPAITGTHRNVSGPGLDENDLMPEVDIFFSTDHERLRFLAEFLLNRDEQEMERLQLGWLIQPAATLWVGRFHTPLGFWNSEHHHGAFMQTTISRPSILDFEDDSGMLPTHITGMLAEGSLDHGHGSINYAFGIGQGPELESELVPVNILEFRNGGKLAGSARLSYRPLDVSASELGAFAGYANIPVIGSPINEVDQTVAGVFYNWESGELRLLGEFFYVINRLDSPASAKNSDFRAGYLQAEYQIHDSWTVFGRLEGTADAKNNAYLDLNPEFMAERAMVGARFEASSRQALKLELSRNETQDDTRFNQLDLQWSMVYP